MNVTLQEDNLFGEDGPQAGERLWITEIRKVDGEYWAFTVQVVEQDTFCSWLVPLDKVLYAHTETTETYWSTLP